MRRISFYCANRADDMVCIVPRAHESDESKTIVSDASLASRRLVSYTGEEWSGLDVRGRGHALSEHVLFVARPTNTGVGAPVHDVLDLDASVRVVGMSVHSVICCFAYVLFLFSFSFSLSLCLLMKIRWVVNI